MVTRYRILMLEIDLSVDKYRSPNSIVDVCQSSMFSRLHVDTRFLTAKMRNRLKKYPKNQ